MIDSTPELSARAGYHAYDLSQGTDLSWNERRTSDLAVGLRHGDLAGGEIALSAFYVDDQFDVHHGLDHG